MRAGFEVLSVRDFAGKHGHDEQPNERASREQPPKESHGFGEPKQCRHLSGRFCLMKVDVNASRSIGTSSNELQLGRPQTPVRADLRVSRTICAVSPKSRSDCDEHPWLPP